MQKTKVGELKIMLDLKEQNNLILCYAKFLLNPMLCLKSNLKPIINLNFSLILQNSKFSLKLQNSKFSLNLC